MFQGHGRLLATRFAVTEALFNFDDGYAYPSGNQILDLAVADTSAPVTAIDPSTMNRVGFPLLAITPQ